MARGGMRVGEVLKLRAMDVHDRKLTLRDPKSGKDREHVFIPQKVADRLTEYIRDNGIQPDQRIFPLSYEAIRSMVKKGGFTHPSWTKKKKTGFRQPILQVSLEHSR